MAETGAERQRRYRARCRAQRTDIIPRNEPVGFITPTRNVTEIAGQTVTRVTPDQDRNAPAEHGDLIGPDVYYQPRTNPHLINWGEPMTSDQLADYARTHKLSHYVNRVSIPGDWDYSGVAA